MFYEQILSFTRNRNPLGALFQDKNNAIEKNQWTQILMVMYLSVCNVP